MKMCHQCRFARREHPTLSWLCQHLSSRYQPPTGPVEQYSCNLVRKEWVDATFCGYHAQFWEPRPCEP